jgi:hypothetical protein
VELEVTYILIHTKPYPTTGLATKPIGGPFTSVPRSVFSKEVASEEGGAGRTNTQTVTTTRADLESMVTRPVLEAIERLRKEAAENREAGFEGKLARRTEELVRDGEGKIRALEGTIDSLQIEAAERYKEWVLEKAKLVNRQVYLEAGLKQAFEKQNQIHKDWIRKTQANNDMMKNVRASLDIAVARYKRAEKPREGELRVEAKLTERSRSGEGRSQSSRDRGKRDDEHGAGKKASSDKRREPTDRDSSRETTGSRRGGEKRAEPAGEKEDRGGMNQSQRSAKGDEAEDQTGSKENEQEPMQLTQRPESAGTGRKGKPWGEADVESSTGVVDLCNTSFTSVEAPEGSTAKEDDREEVNYEASSGVEDLSEEEVEGPAPAAPESMAPEIVLSKEEVARKRKNAKAKIKRDLDKALAAKSQGGEGEVDTSQVPLATSRGQDAEGASTIQKRKRVIADDDDGEVITEEKERSSEEA